MSDFYMMYNTGTKCLLLLLHMWGVCVFLFVYLAVCVSCTRACV